MLRWCWKFILWSRNSCIYVWVSQNLTITYDVHGTGFVGAIKWCDGKIVSGAKDGKVVISNPEDGTNEKTIDVGELIRSVNMKGSKILAGLRNGTILKIDSKDSKKEIIKSHSDGETWGLAVADKDTFVTSGNDNKIYVWDAKTRKSTALAEFCDYLLFFQSCGINFFILIIFIWYTIITLECKTWHLCIKYVTLKNRSHNINLFYFYINTIYFKFF